MDTAWKLILSKRTSHPEALRQVAADNADGDYMNSRQFSGLHRTILGLEAIKLEQLPGLLRLTQAVDINATDAMGMTSLAWAAAANDVEVVRILLDHGADPNIANQRWETPLMHTTDPGCLQLLLDARADIEARDLFGRVPLGHATRETRCFEILLNREPNLNPVGGVAQVTIVQQCVIGRHPAALKLLLDRGADYRITTKDNSTIVHIAMKHADATTLHLLSQVRLRGFNMDTANSLGETGFSLAERRKEKFPELRPAIEAFIASLQPWCSSTPTPTDTEQINDALEPE